MKHPVAIVLIATLALSTGVTAQNASNPPAAPDCPASATELPVQALYGRWEVRFEGVAEPARVELARHPEYAGSVRGTIDRSGAIAQLSGDIDDDGQLALDESRDGRAISAVWSGNLQAGSCGKEFHGTWRNSIDDSTRTFVLRKTGGWQ